TPLQAGAEYRITVFPASTLDNQDTDWVYNPQQQRSEAVHVNNLGYRPEARRKVGYVYHWLGDGGSLDLSAYDQAAFGLRSTVSGEVVYTGTLTFRASADRPGTLREEDVETPKQNFLGGEVYEGDFSDFNVPGSYVFFVEGIGASFPFEIGCDAVRPAYTTAMKGLYHNRSGIALEEPYTSFTRPAPHHPTKTPGFADRLVYSSHTFCEAIAEDSDENDRAAYDAGVCGNLDATWGWYQDAGDWDGYLRHLEIPAKLLLTYEHFTENFADGDLNIPESGNGLPDILDEARWLIRFYKRAKDETEGKGWTTGGVPGGRIFADLWGEDIPGETGQGSWQDNHRRWVLSGEDPTTTYRYAALCAHLADLLDRDNLTDPEDINWDAEARAAFTWAEARYQADYFCHDHDVRDFRAYAAAALFRLTGEVSYDQAFRATRQDEGTSPTETLPENEAIGPYLYVTTPGADPTLVAEFNQGFANVADFILLQSAEQRGLRYGGNLFFPMLVGQATTPYVFEGIMAMALLKESQPEKAADYLEVLHNTADYFLGANPLNMTWITGVGDRSPRDVFDLDSRYAGHEFIKPGVVPYGPWRDVEIFGNQGPFNHRWANKTVYPDITDWPGHERWFANRYAPIGNEYTVHQNTVNAAALYGALAGEWKCADTDGVQGAGTSRSIAGQSLGVFPNPTSGRIELQLPVALPQAQVRVYGSSGEQIAGIRPQGNALELGHLPAGIYVVSVTAQDYHGVARVVVH
ncbi:MAG: glycoside hydrolase family 9 protein, partial [Bacteroidota bacterium]